MILDLLWVGSCGAGTITITSSTSIGGRQHYHGLFDIRNGIHQNATSHSIKKVNGSFALHSCKK